MAGSALMPSMPEGDISVASNERHDIVLIGLHEAVKLSLFPG